MEYIWMFIGSLVALFVAWNIAPTNVVSRSVCTRSETCLVSGYVFDFLGAFLADSFKDDNEGNVVSH